MLHFFMIDAPTRWMPPRAEQRRDWLGAGGVDTHCHRLDILPVETNDEKKKKKKREEKRRNSFEQQSSLVFLILSGGIQIQRRHYAEVIRKSSQEDLQEARAGRGPPREQQRCEEIAPVKSQR